LDLTGAGDYSPALSFLNLLFLWFEFLRREIQELNLLPAGKTFLRDENKKNCIF
jgi:hypothetical protein